MTGESGLVSDPGTSPGPGLSPTYSIAVVNESTVVTDDEVEAWVAALQVQVSQHFGPIWGLDAHLTVIGAGQASPSDAWQLLILDDSDQATALGYHDVTANGAPLGKVFARSDLQAQAQPSVACSHELIEMLADPELVTTIMFQDDGGQTTLFPLEVCDMCEADEYGYEINGVLVSDFAYPRWFDGRPPTGVDSDARLDYAGHLTTVLTLADPTAAILPGGYLSYWTPSGGWSQLTGPDRDGDPSAVAPPGSRRQRRARRGDWRRSAASPTHQPAAREPAHHTVGHAVSREPVHP